MIAFDSLLQIPRDADTLHLVGPHRKAPGFSQEAEETRENLAWMVRRRQDRAGEAV